MDYLSRLQGCLCLHTNTGTVQEISKISCPGQNAIQTVHSSHGVYSDSKGGETDGHTLGYKDTPIPRQLVGESQIPPELSWLVNLEKSELVRPTPPTKKTGTTILTGLSGLAIHVLDRSAN